MQWASRITALADGLRVGNAELADLIGVDAATIWRWRQGGEPPSHATQHVVAALEQIVESSQVEVLFRAIKAHHLKPRTLKFMQLVFHLSSRGRFSK